LSGFPVGGRIYAALSRNPRGRETKLVVKRCGHVLRSHARAIIF
jgi:hypothetical protein